MKQTTVYVLLIGMQCSFFSVNCYIPFLANRPFPTRKDIAFGKKSVILERTAIFEPYFASNYQTSHLNQALDGQSKTSTYNYMGVSPAMKAQNVIVTQFKMY